MRLLIVTQKMDAADANLGFFVTWIEELAKCAEVTVIANEVGIRELAAKRAHIFSLGKERGASRFGRFFRYQKLLWRHLPQVDGVFFHMCPEYVLGAHALPRLFCKRTLLWYVHKEVSWRLRLAALFVHRVLTASQESCRLRSKKVEIVGHGVTAEFFAPRGTSPRGLRLITAGRIAPVKDLRTLILGFLELRKRFSDATLSIAGEPITNADRLYREELRGLSTDVRFLGGVSHKELSRFLGETTAFVHASRTGSIDKAVLEALAAGLPVFSSSNAFSEAIPGVVKFREGDPTDLAEKLINAYERGEFRYNEEGRGWVRENHSLDALVKKIITFYSGFPLSLASLKLRRSRRK